MGQRLRLHGRLARATAWLLACALACTLGCLALGCAADGATTGASDAQGSEASLEKYPESDMSGYACSQGYDKPYHFVDMTVKDLADQMREKSSFAFYCGYSDCPWCNVMLNHLNNVAGERGVSVGYLDTRSNPEWKSNTDVEDYDVLVELLGSAIDEDDGGEKHLFVPHVFFIKDGELVYDHAGTAAGQDDAEQALSDNQIEELEGAYREGFEKIGQ